MAIRFYRDVHVPQAMTDQLRRRGIDVLTAMEDDSEELLEYLDFMLMGRAHPTIHCIALSEILNLVTGMPFSCERISTNSYPFFLRTALNSSIALTFSSIT